MYRILVLEDAIDYQMLIKKVLNDDSFVVTITSTVAEAENLARQGQFDLMLFDVNLPDGDGFQLCASLRNEPKFADTPIIFLTGKADPPEKVMGFSLGADDYVTKPFDPSELRARIQARLRRSHTIKEKEESFRKGNLRLSSSSQQVFIYDGAKEMPLDLTPLEYRLLAYMAQREEQVFSREQLITAVRGSNIHILDRTIDTHISNLRKKISSSGYSIKSVYGVGYSFTKFVKAGKSKSA